MGTYSSWEAILVGLLALLVIFWFSPAIKAAIERGRQTEPDWGAALAPLGLVALFVLLLILAS